MSGERSFSARRPTHMASLFHNERRNIRTSRSTPAQRRGLTPQVEMVDRALSADSGEAHEPHSTWVSVPGSPGSRTRKCRGRPADASVGQQSSGFYIDVGAHDPLIDSVTKAFYDRGWRGINVEPVPESHRRVSAERTRDINLCVGCSDRRGRATLLQAVGQGTGLSTFSEADVARHERGGVQVQAHPGAHHDSGRHLRHPCHRADGRFPQGRCRRS